jgi:hypothetical protein
METSEITVRSTQESVASTEPFLELYVGEDILQGEQVPFYAIWKNVEVRMVSIHCYGFKRVVKVYNASDFERTLDGIVVDHERLKLDGYIGGVLSTSQGSNAAEQAALKVVFGFKNGESKELLCQRTLYSIRAKLSRCPNRILLPLRKGERPILVELLGAATATIEISKMPLSINLGVPIEIASAMQRYYGVIKDGLEELKTEFPKYQRFLSRMVDEELASSLSKYNRVMSRYIKKYRSDEEFMQSLAYLFVSAILEEESVRGLLFLPLIEYFESSATMKAFLESPLLSAAVPKGGGRLRCKIVLRDLLGQQCGRPIVVDTHIESQDEVLLQLKDLVGFERI